MSFLCLEQRIPDTHENCKPFNNKHLSNKNKMEIAFSCQEMGRILNNVIIVEDTHEENNMFILTVIAHGNKEGHLKDTTGKKAWTIDELVEDVCDVKSLRGKPKIFFFQSCRGGVRLQVILL